MWLVLVFGVAVVGVNFIGAKVIGVDFVSSK
jgi:hypothetical protein